MNLPVGEVISEGASLTEFKPKDALAALSEKLFSGYVVAMIEGFDGLEEGIALFRKGAVIASAYEYCKYGITVFGDSSLEQFLNAMAAKFGVVDVIALTPQQVELVTAFNDKLKLARELEKKELAKMFPKDYTTKHAQNVLSQVLKREETKYDLLKKLGLSELGK